MKFPESPPLPSAETLRIESLANYEGNMTELLLKRVSHPTIRGQIVALLSAKENHRAAYFEACIPSPHDSQMIRDAFGQDYPASTRDNYVKPSVPDMEASLDARITEVSRYTPISFDQSGISSVDAIEVNCAFPGQAKMTTKQQSIVEAHEKGHILRPYWFTFFDEYFQSGFESSKSVFARGDPFIDSLVVQEPDLSPEALQNGFVDYLFTGGELAERMAQLKNYFGMSGDEAFTKAHLDYARLHYIEDTNMDNFMKQFFQAITPETESNFLRLINTSGI